MNSDIERILEKERFRQSNEIQLIASENYASDEVLKLSGSLFTNKYAEGYPGARYYNGCENYDEIENLAIDLVTELFESKFANVQPHSGANANLAVMYALLKPGDKILGMDLSSGGHLSHGSSVNISGNLYNSVGYGVDNTGHLDYNNIEELAIKHQPRMIIAGASAYPKQIDWHMFKNIADKVGAYLVCDMAHYSGLIAGGAYENPCFWADVITSTTHKTLRGPRGGIILWNDDKFSKKINSAVFPGTQGGPLMNQIAAKAQCFWEAKQNSFRDYCWSVKEHSWMMAEKFKSLGIKLVCNGTQSHIILLDLSDKNITGKELADALQQQGITVNKNSIPNDKRSPKETSGIRIGTAAETTKRGNNNALFFESIAEKIVEVIEILEK